MADRERMADVELRVHRIARAEDTLGIATEIRNAAIAVINGSSGMKLQYPVLATRLRSSFAALTALGGPALPSTAELGDITPEGGTTSERIQQVAQTAAQEIELAISADAALRLDRSPEP